MDPSTRINWLVCLHLWDNLLIFISQALILLHDPAGYFDPVADCFCLFIAAKLSGMFCNSKIWSVVAVTQQVC